MSEPTPLGKSAPPRRAVTLRSVALGLAGVAFIALYSDFNNMVVKPGPTLAGNQLPIFPLALVLLIGGVWNPLAGRLWPRLRLGAGELTVALVMMVVSVWLPGYGIYRSFEIQLARPLLLEPSQAHWQKHETLSYLPEHLLPLGGDRTHPDFDRVYRGFDEGLPEAERGLHVSAVPWGPWVAVMAWWAPLFMLFGTALGALAVLVHRQWSKHEQLAYPIASVYAAVLPGPDGGSPPLLRSKLFWLGVLPPAIFYLNNWAAIMTGKFPWITHMFWPGEDLRTLFPILRSIDMNVRGDMIWSIVGLAFFVPTEVSFSMAVGYFFYLACALQIYLVSGRMITNPESKNVVAGAYLMYAFILIGTGRTYYWAMLTRAFRRARPGEEDHAGPWAARILMLATGGFVWLLAYGFGFDWLVALVYGLALLLFFLVVTRVICETGVPFMQAEFDMGMVLGNALGFPMLGPAAIVLVYWLGSILNFDTRVCFMPFAANALKLSETTGVRLRSLVPLALVAIVLALCLGFAARTYNSYAYGAKRDDYHVLAHTSAHTFNLATTGLTVLSETDRMAESAAATGLGKLPLIADNQGHGRELGWLVFGAAGVALLSAVRFRFPGFPLHPVVFLIWATWPSQLLWFSFFLGWSFKVAVVKYGGARGYHAAKPFFLGIIVGELMIGALFLVTQLLYWLSTGTPRGTGYFGG